MKKNKFNINKPAKTQRDRLNEKYRDIRKDWEKEKDWKKSKVLLGELADKYYMSEDTIYMIVAFQGKYANLGLLEIKAVQGKLF